MALRLAWRSLWRNRRRTLITVVSIGLGLTCAVFFICFAEGVYHQLIEDVVRMQAGHVTVEHKDYQAAPAVDLFVGNAERLRTRIGELAEVQETKLLVLGQGVARSGTGSVGASVMGVEPSVEAKMSMLPRHMVGGRYLEDADEARVVVGTKLAERLHLAEGKKLVLTTNDASGALTEELFRVAGVFETGVEEIDGYLLQMPISFARRLYGLPAGSATQVGAVLKDSGDEARVLHKVSRLVEGGESRAYPWQEIIPEVASYIRVDRSSNWIFQGILLFLILFTIFNTILMSVLERQREFAVLLALGTSPWLLRRQIVLESFFIGILGSALGLTLGGLAAYALEVYGFDITRLYGQGVSISGAFISPIMHARVTARILFWLGVIVIGATLLISLVPMRRATRVNIVDELR
jgi:ABC-type lipoprotein release transport system permease subunit